MKLPQQNTAYPIQQPTGYLLQPLKQPTAYPLHSQQQPTLYPTQPQQLTTYHHQFQQPPQKLMGYSLQQLAGYPLQPCQ